ncbi:MAG: hypothetical protein AAF182_02685 [Pseudomonadota bacterium]
MSNISKISFIDNNAAVARPDQFVEAKISVEKAIQSWRLSVFSFEWMNKDGSIKSAEELSPREQPKRLDVERRVEQGNPLPKPILGIGLEDNIEIGSERAVFLTLAALGADSIPVHIPASNQDDFQDFIV